MTAELRCANKLHAVITDGGLVEIACRSSRCGWKAGLVVLHYFDPCSTELKETKIFRGPPSPGKPKEQTCHW